MRVVRYTHELALCYRGMRHSAPGRLPFFELLTLNSLVIWNYFRLNTVTIMLMDKDDYSI
jgi:hypothetical protein